MRSRVFLPLMVSLSRLPFSYQVDERFSKRVLLSFFKDSFSSNGLIISKEICETLYLVNLYYISIIFILFAWN
jgi:hypothetical protein